MHIGSIQVGPEDPLVVSQCEHSDRERSSCNFPQCRWNCPSERVIKIILIVNVIEILAVFVNVTFGKIINN